jgi:hypothetical protein
MKLPLVLFSCFTVLFYTTSYSYPAFGATPSQVEQSILEVIQNKETRLISVRAKDASLKNVMQRISKVTGLVVKSPNASILDETVEINLKDITLKETIDLLLQGVNSVFFYSSKPVVEKDATPRLTKVMLLSRKEAVPSRAITNQSKDVANNTPKDQSNPVRLRLLAIIQSSLGRSILEKKLFSTESILKELLENGTEEEIKEAIAALSDIIAQPSLYNQARNGHVFHEAIEAFKKLDPKGGESFLTNLLQENSEPWVQSLAAQSLGEMGQTSSIPALTAAYASDDPLVQQAAANSLAIIGTDIGVGELFKATASGGPALQQEIINSLALSGDEKTQAALDQAVTDNIIPAESVSEEAVAQLTESENN